MPSAESDRFVPDILSHLGFSYRQVPDPEFLESANRLEAKAEWNDYSIEELPPYSQIPRYAWYVLRLRQKAAAAFHSPLQTGEAAAHSPDHQKYAHTGELWEDSCQTPDRKDFPHSLPAEEVWLFSFSTRNSRYKILPDTISVCPEQCWEQNTHKLADNIDIL